MAVSDTELLWLSLLEAAGRLKSLPHDFLRDDTISPLPLSRIGMIRLLYSLPRGERIFPNALQNLQTI